MSTYEANRYNFSGANVTGIPTSAISSGTFADARLSSSSVTQHVDLSNLNASNLTSGTVPDARVSSGSVTQHVSAVTQATGTWTPSPADGTFYSTTGRYFRVGNHVTVLAHGLFGDNSSGRTDNNTNLWYISGLPITSANVGTVVGGGVAYFGNQGGNSVYPSVGNNSTVIRFFGDGAVIDYSFKSIDVFTYVDCHSFDERIKKYYGRK